MDETLIHLSLSLCAATWEPLGRETHHGGGEEEGEGLFLRRVSASLVRQASNLI